MVVAVVAFVMEHMGIQLAHWGVGKVRLQCRIFLHRPQNMMADPHKGQCAPAKVPDN
jgi:hypothetical protein